jgi:integrase
MTAAARTELPRGMTRDPKTGTYRIGRMVDGQRIQRRADTRVEADAIHSRLYGTRQAVRTTRAKVSPYVRDWIVDQDLRPTSRRSFESLWRNYIATSTIANRPLAELEDFELVDYLDDLGRQRGSRTGRRLSTATVGQVRKLLSAVLNDAERKRHIERNPIRLVQGPKVRHAKVQPPTVDDVQRILAELETRPEAAAYRLAAMTGMRSGEVFGLRWQDVDLAGRQLTIRGTLDAKTLLWMATTKTDDSARTIGLPASVVLALTVLQQQPRRRRAFPVDLVFVTSTGGAISPSNANKRVQRAAVSSGVTAERKARGLADLTFHTLRHAFVTILREDGVDLEDVSKSVGHHSTRITSSTYSHTTDRRRQAVADAAEAIFAGG